MKKISIAILAIIAIVAIIVACKKTPEVNLEYVDVERDLITVGTTTATIQCDYQYIATLKKAYLYYGEGEDATDMFSAEMRVVQNTLYVDLSGLKENTTYSYYYEFVNGFNSMRSAVKTFKTEASPLIPPEIMLPTVVTAEVTEITANSAKGGGEVTNDGGAEVTERGICWSTNENPTLSDSHVAAGVGTGVFTALMDGLQANTTYHVRAYAINEAGTAFGLDKEFKTLLGGGGNGNAPIGAIDGLFTINNKGDQVYFSQGNLQYQASTNTWRFAEHQWDFVGSVETDDGCEPGGTIPGSSNHLISSTYDGWIDLFGWGTSGWDNGNTYYQPWDSDFDSQLGNGFGYGPYNGWSHFFDLNGTFANADWGIYNPISNGGNTPNTWRTLQESEWHYLIFERSTSSGNRCALACVNGVNGLLLLPDNWDNTICDLVYVNEQNGYYADNVINVSQLSVLESAGVVFLPNTGSRTGTSVSSLGSGCYWTSSHSTNLSASGLLFSNGWFGFENGNALNIGKSVRLVSSNDYMVYSISSEYPWNAGRTLGSGCFEYGEICNMTAIAKQGYYFAYWYEDGERVSYDRKYSFTVDRSRALGASFFTQNEVPTGVINSLFTINDDGDQVYFSQGNLQYQASTNTWRFADNQWDYVGEGNSSISQSNNNWIDLFGWGTSGWDCGNTYFSPWDASNLDTEIEQFGPPGISNLTGNYANSDWGVYNAIINGGNQSNQWRTLTQEEWTYVFFRRDVWWGDARFAKGIIDNKRGVILVPDNWNTNTYMHLNDFNDINASFSSNVFSSSQWSAYQDAGAVFLPAAGDRSGTNVFDVDTYGAYWSASTSSSRNANNMYFNDTDLNTESDKVRCYGQSVRLVQDYIPYYQKDEK